MLKCSSSRSYTLNLEVPVPNGDKLPAKRLNEVTYSGFLGFVFTINWSEWVWP